MKKIDYSLTLKQIYIKALPVTILLIIGATLVYQLLWNNLFAALSNLWLRIYIFIPAILILSLLHEVLHILGFWLLGKTRRQDWHIGIKSGTPYAHCSTPMKINAYRISVIIPGLLLGIIPLLLSFAWGWPIVFVYAILMTTAALGDFFILLEIRKLSSSSFVSDHASKPGCWLLNP